MNEEQFRSRIYWVTFLFSMLVVWVHSYNGELFLGLTGQAAMVDRIERAVGEQLGQMAVPGFFMVSAYLFYRRFTWEKLLYKWKSRVHSVLIPYFLWNFLYYMAYVLATRIPAVTRLIGKTAVPFDGGQLVRAVAFYGYNPVFWYLFQLILLIALAPLVWLLMRSNATAALTFGALALVIWKGWYFPFLNADALFYYSAGAWAALHREREGRFAESGRIGDWAAAAGVLAFLGTAAVLFGRPGMALWQNPLQTVLIRFVMAAAAWMAVSLAPLPPAFAWMKQNFFLYAVHFALVRLVNKAGALALGGNAAAALGNFPGHARGYGVCQLWAVPFAGAVSAGGVRGALRWARGAMRNGPGLPCGLIGYQPSRGIRAVFRTSISAPQSIFPGRRLHPAALHGMIITLLRKFFPQDASD